MQRPQDAGLEKAIVDEHQPLLPGRSSKSRSSLITIKRIWALSALFALFCLFTFPLLSSVAHKAFNILLKTHAWDGPPALMKDGPIIKGVVLDNNQEAWYGIRYAKPPVGALRWAKPQPLFKTSTSSNPLQNLKKGKICPQDGDTSKQSEDCLFINIQRPRRYIGEEKLPVMLFFHGGGFQGGSGSSVNPTEFIKISQQVGQDVIVATINYRLGALGFMASSDFESLTSSEAEIMADDSLVPAVAFNRGFLDQREAIAWVNRNIDSFGGDKNRLTIWGQSAGAFGVGAQLLNHYPSLNSSSNSKEVEPPLFQAAILQSGAPGGVPIVSPSDKDKVYNRFLRAVQCDQYATATRRLACLRKKEISKIVSASVAEQRRADQRSGIEFEHGAYPWTGVLDGGPTKNGGFFSDYPGNVLRKGQFADVAILNGNNQDEGTIFVPQDLENGRDLKYWFEPTWQFNPFSKASNQTYETIVNDYYPDVPSEGSPYEPRGASPSDRFFFGNRNQYKRAASVYNDLRFHSARRLLLEQFVSRPSTTNRAFSYLYSYKDPSMSPDLGASHGADLDCVMQSTKASVCPLMAQYWVNFAHEKDPNGQSSSDNWPAYSLSDRRILGFSDEISEISDDYRAEAMEYLNFVEVINNTGR